MFVNVYSIPHFYQIGPQTPQAAMEIFKKIESECRLIELIQCEHLISYFVQSISNNDQNLLLPTYRELLSLVTGLQTSTPIIVENK